MGVDLAGIMLAGVALGLLMRSARETLRRSVPPKLPAPRPLRLAVLVLAPAWVERIHYDHRGAAEIRAQRAYDATRRAETSTG